MKTALPSFLVILMLGALPFQAAHAQGADAVATCFNPRQSVSLKFSPSGKAQEAEMVVQFNIRRQAIVDAIFVDEKNNGICEIVVRNGKKIVGDPKWSLAGGKEDPPGTFSKVSVAAKTTQKDASSVATFEVAVGKAEQNSTVQLRMAVEFQ